jgi:hypothetical protein
MLFDRQHEPQVRIALTTASPPRKPRLLVRIAAEFVLLRSNRPRERARRFTDHLQGVHMLLKRRFFPADMARLDISPPLRQPRSVTQPGLSAHAS